MTEIVAELTQVAAITAALTQPSAITASAAAPSAITASVGTVAAITASVAAPAAITAAVGSVAAITAGLTAVQALEAELEVDVQTALDSMQQAARQREDVTKLASTSATIAVHTASPAAVELPTGLVLYPSFRDSGFLTFDVAAAHANMSGATVNVALVYSVFGGASNVVANFTSPVFPAGAGPFTWQFAMKLLAQGPTSEAYIALMTWSDPTGQYQQPFSGRTNSGIFGDPANGDNGDAEVRLEISVSSGAVTFNVRHVSIEQHCPRSVPQ